MLRGDTRCVYMFRPICQISHWPTGQPIGKADNLLAYRSTYWPTGRFCIWINPLANQEIWCIDQPTGNVVNWCTKFLMLIPSTKLLVYTPSQPLNLFFLLPLCMPSHCHSCYTLFPNCCIGSLSCTQSASCSSSLWTWGSIYQGNFSLGGK